MAMTFDEFLEYVQSTLPGSQVGEDNEGQVVIYTGCHVDDNDRVVPIIDPADLPS